MKKNSLMKLASGLLGSKEPLLAWQPAERAYPRLVGLDLAVHGVRSQAGIYVVWHLGVRPRWLRAGVSNNLGTTFEVLAHARWIQLHQDNAGVFVAWAFPPQHASMGMVRFLTEKLQPAFQNEVLPDDISIGADVVPVTCPLPPGTRT